MTPGYHRAAVALRHATSVVVCGHVRPDGDAIGSALAATLALRAAGIAAVPTLADDEAPPATYSFLPGFALFTPAADLEPPLAFLALDTPKAERLGVAASLAESARSLVVLDHHPDATEFGAVNVLDPTSAATGQMVWRLIEALEVEPTPEIALCCFVALQTDTGRFQYSNVTPQTFLDASAMVAAGVDVAEASRLVYQSRTAAAMALEARALSHLTLANDGRVAYAWVTDADFDATGARSEDTEHLVDAVRALGEVDVAALLTLRGGEVRVNLRAKSRFDVSTVARRFGGGGHVAASGFTWDGELETLLPQLLDVLPGGPNHADGTGGDSASSSTSGTQGGSSV